MSVQKVSVIETFKACQNPSCVLLDVREADEVAEVAAAGIKHVAMSELNPATFSKDHGVSKETPLYIICRSGGRSMRVALALEQEGFTQLHNVEGGTLAWQAEGLPLN